MFLSLFIMCLIQSITEYIPVSSTAHMLIFERFSGLDTSNLLLHVGLHLGTLFAILLFYIKDVTLIVVKTLHGIFRIDKRESEYYQQGIALLIATIPVLFVGFLIKPYIADLHNNWKLMSISSILFGGLLSYVDYYNPESIKKIRYKDALWIGLGQLFAFIPGGSRLGTTVTIARLFGFSRHIAFRFSILLSLPVVLGAVTLTSYDALKQGIFIMNDQLVTVIGVTFFFGLLTLAIMDKFIHRIGFAGFGLYRILLGIIMWIVVSFL